jgi:hypothetical protein
MPYLPVRSPQPPPAPVAAPDPVKQLQDLAALHDAGSLTDDEFSTAKRAVLEAGE